MKGPRGSRPTPKSRTLREAYAHAQFEGWVYGIPLVYPKLYERGLRKVGPSVQKFHIRGLGIRVEGSSQVTTRSLAVNVMDYVTHQASNPIELPLASRQFN